MTGPYVVRHLEPCECEDGWVVPTMFALEDVGDVDLRRTCGDCNGEAARVVSVKAFETPARLRRALAGEDYLDLEGLAGMPDATRADIEAAQAQLEALVRDGRVELPDGSEIVVETTSWSDLAAAVDYLGRGFVREEEWPEVLAAFNAAMAERYGTEARA